MTQRRAPRGYTYDPCPGCQGVYDNNPRLKDRVCYHCQAILDGHAKQRAEQEKKGENPVLPFAVPDRAHWLPYLSEQHDGSKRPIQDAFHKLTFAVSVANDGSRIQHKERLYEPKIHDSNSWSGYHDKDYRLMPRSTALELRALFNAVRDGLEVAYKKGRSDGSNLLTMLAAGELATPDFERRAGITHD